MKLSNDKAMDRKNALVPIPFNQRKSQKIFCSGTQSVILMLVYVLSDARNTKS